MFLVVKIGIRRPIHSESFMSPKLSVLLFYPTVRYEEVPTTSLVPEVPPTVHCDWLWKDSVV